MKGKFAIYTQSQYDERAPTHGNESMEFTGVDPEILKGGTQTKNMTQKYWKEGDTSPKILIIKSQFFTNQKGAPAPSRPSHKSAHNLPREFTHQKI